LVSPSRFRKVLPALVVGEKDTSKERERERERERKEKRRYTQKNTRVIHFIFDAEAENIIERNTRARLRGTSGD